MNGSVLSTGEDSEASKVLGYQPETPFMTDGAAMLPPRSIVAGSALARTSYEMESPFEAEYGAVPGEHDARAEAFAELLGELEDEEFEEAVVDLVHEVSALTEE